MVKNVCMCTANSAKHFPPSYLSETGSYFFVNFSKENIQSGETIMDQLRYPFNQCRTLIILMGFFKNRSDRIGLRKILRKTVKLNYLQRIVPIECIVLAAALLQIVNDDGC